MAQEPLLRIDEQPDYDTSYMEDRHVSKDRLLSYRANRYPVPFRHARKTVLVREPVSGGKIEIYPSGDTRIIAEHRLAEGRGATVIDPDPYQGWERRDRTPRVPRGSPGGSPQGQPPAGLPPGPGVGCGLVPPEVEQRPLSVYEEVADVAAAAWRNWIPTTVSLLTLAC
ncbi:MAG: Mu transposase domain-containing protein [Bryobacteraceae bacterium]